MRNLDIVSGRHKKLPEYLGCFWKEAGTNSGGSTHKTPFVKLSKEPGYLARGRARRMLFLNLRGLPDATTDASYGRDMPSILDRRLIFNGADRHWAAAKEIQQDADRSFARNRPSFRRPEGG